jgi:hypothetical protein
MIRSPRRAALLVLGSLVCAACSGGPADGPGASAAAPTPTAPPAPTAGAFQIALPVSPGDWARSGLGLWPFGVHGADHALDGHPGWDIEFRPGAPVRAAAAGIVQSLAADGSAPGSFTIQLDHRLATGNYRTVYAHVATLATGVTVGANVADGQALGVALVQTRMIGSRTVTYAAIHFQVDDFSASSGLTNVNAVNPERWLTAEGQASLSAIWPGAAYFQELCEPFLENPRAAGFPFRRVWTHESGAGASQIVFVRPDASAAGYQYELRDRLGQVSERGTASLEPLALPVSAIDFTPDTGAIRRGVYDVVDDTLRLDMGNPSAPRPASLSGASVYRTVR